MADAGLAGATSQVQPYGPPPYAPPPGYAAPAFAPAYPPPYAPLYAPPYGPYPFALAAPPDGKTVRPTLAAVFWIFVLVRDLLFLVLVTIWWVESANFGFTPNFPFGLVDEPWLLIAITVGGLGSSTAALIFDLMREKHFYGTIAGLISAACCVTPGLLFGFGVVGVALSAIAIAFHLVSAQEFAQFEARARAARGLPAR